MKSQRLEKGSSSTNDTFSNTYGKASMHASSAGKASPPATLWSNFDFDTLSVKSYHLSFSKEFPID